VRARCLLTRDALRTPAIAAVGEGAGAEAPDARQLLTDNARKGTIFVLSLRDEYVDTNEAARLLGVTVQHVRRLGEQGDILIPFRGLVDRGSIEQYLAERRSSRGRGWDEHTAWPAVALLSGLNVDWLGQVQTSRLRARLRHLATYPKGARDLVGRTRTRATIHTYGAYDFITGRLKKEILVVGRRDLGLTEATGASLGGYVVADDLTRLVKRYALESDTRGKLVLRTTSFDIASIKRIVSKGNGALAAFDAAASTDPREHGVGDRFLTRLLKDFARG